MTGKGAFILADTTADAEFRNEVRLPQVNGFSFVVDYSDLLEFDGLVMGWTVFLADNAGAVGSERQTPFLVKDRHADNKGLLCRLAQFVDGAGGTDLAA